MYHNSPFNILITGSTNGIGRSLCTYLYEQGHSVCGLDKVLPIEESWDDIGRARFIKLDLSKSNEIETLPEKLRQLDFYPDILINNAATYGANLRHSLVETSDEELNEILLTNFIAPFKLIKQFINTGKKDNILIINVLTQVAFLPAPGRAVYAASKAALQSLTMSLAHEYEDGCISAVGVHPGKPVRTPGIENRRPSGYSYTDYANPDILNNIVKHIISNPWSEHSGKILSP